MIPFAVIIHDFHSDSILRGHADYFFFAGSLVLGYSTWQSNKVFDLSGLLI